MHHLILARITAYQDRLIFESVSKSIVNEKALISSKHASQAILNTGQHLGISPEALRLLQTTPIGHVEAFDVSWELTNDGLGLFTWKGHPYNIKTFETCFRAPNFKILQHVTIDNNSPAAAIAAIKKITKELKK